MKISNLIEAVLLRIGPIVPDKIYLGIRYRLATGYWMNFRNPKTLNEKLQWLKLYNRKPEYTTYVDKYAVKEYVADLIGNQYIIPTLGVWDTAEEIDFEKLPHRFVLKPTHNSSTGRCICKNKKALDIPYTIKSLTTSLPFETLTLYILFATIIDKSSS